MVGKWRYQRCLDALEGLIMARMFKLTKSNMSQTGAPLPTLFSIVLTMKSSYKLQKYIRNALKACSKAVCTTLQNYNVAAQGLVPPWPALSWDDIVEYTFLADFELLSDTRSDICLRVWAKPASCALMDQYFKMERVCEEITRLNVEIPRLTTYIRDEEAFLIQQEELLSQSDLPLSCQLHMCCLKLIWSNDLHIHQFNKLASLPGFSGTIELGISLEAAAHQRAENDICNQNTA